ncbi:MAG: pyridoxine 5'-phosphate synthase, partial [Paludibacteraceae bacterium]|nr:pyridoxine 5'-phosphate synthase [Paludibacteraceae bacterium]
KIATLRNARGGNLPNVVQAAIRCQEFGAEGITVHPRPDERHIRYADVYDLKSVVTTEFNIEGYPCEKFIELVKKVRPTQVTLVPDAPDAITSNEGWDCIANQDFLKDLVLDFQSVGIRVSIFVDTNIENIRAAATTGTDRIELYTEPYAAQFSKDKNAAIAPFIEAAKTAKKLGLGINAGHDLNAENLAFFKQNIPYLDEVSIGHALISDALYLGLQKTVEIYKNALKQ